MARCRSNCNLFCKSFPTPLLQLLRWMFHLYQNILNTLGKFVIYLSTVHWTGEYFNIFSKLSRSILITSSTLLRMNIIRQNTLSENAFLSWFARKTKFFENFLFYAGKILFLQLIPSRKHKPMEGKMDYILDDGYAIVIFVVLFFWPDVGSNNLKIFRKEFRKWMENLPPWEVGLFFTTG